MQISTAILATPQWRALQTSIAAQQVPHALLLSGGVQEGRRFARHFAAFLLCRNPDFTHGRPCANCVACQLFAAETHGDYFFVAPQEGSRTIKVEQIRQLCHVLSTTSQLGGGYRLGVISPADVLNPSAANSLLKTLEEPPAGVVIALLSNRPGALPATIRSRCQRLRIDTAPASLDHAECAEHRHSWEAALEPDGAYLALAERWAKLDYEVTFQALFQWLSGRLRTRLEPVQMKPYLHFYDQLLHCYRCAAQAGISHRALYEQLLLSARALA